MTKSDDNPDNRLDDKSDDNILALSFGLSSEMMSRHLLFIKKFCSKN
jgi:hypothetical protein